jgi:hypothetical protein
MSNHMTVGQDAIRQLLRPKSAAKKAMLDAGARVTAIDRESKTATLHFGNLQAEVGHGLAQSIGSPASVKVLSLQSAGMSVAAKAIQAWGGAPIEGVVVTVQLDSDSDVEAIGRGDVIVAVDEARAFALAPKRPAFLNG